ncbi:MAG: 4-hydroxy-tetrahydrodipicolinate reductase [Chloroflexi bacterium]|nr:MAG: 4-hydroxy-tetrahydrodipicolinate reductase [Chloroflexota bacterium]
MGIRVLVSGSGKMGREVLAAVCLADDLEPAGVVDLFAKADAIALPDGSGAVPFGSDVTVLIEQTRPDVAVDFSNAEWTPRLADAALAAGVRLVIGTTGLTDAFLKNLEEECSRRNLGAVVAPNFAIGAVLMQHISALAARYYESAEIIELHHGGKADAPSGTSIATAKAMAAGHEKPFLRPPTQKETVAGTRGADVDGITIHSVRLPGLVAHQEVILGGTGETLRIRHDSLGRDSYMPGVIMAIRHVMERPGLVRGAGQLLGLK